MMKHEEARIAGQLEQFRFLVQAGFINLNSVIRSKRKKVNSVTRAVEKESQNDIKQITGV
jgi:hypothetical protein